MRPPAMNRIAREGRWLRFGLAAGIALSLVFLALSAPGRKPAFFLCGFHSMSGLPCLFCGGTRAVRAILHGDMRSALYLNALAFPALALVAAAALALLAEAASARPLVPWDGGFRKFGRAVPLLLVPALAWWMIHMYSALRVPKPELVDLRNPIAAGAEALVAPAPPPSCRP